MYGTSRGGVSAGYARLSLVMMVMRSRSTDVAPKARSPPCEPGRAARTRALPQAAATGHRGASQGRRTSLLGECEECSAAVQPAPSAARGRAHSLTGGGGHLCIQGRPGVPGGGGSGVSEDPACSHQSRAGGALGAERPPTTLGTDQDPPSARNTRWQATRACTPPRRRTAAARRAGPRARPRPRPRHLHRHPAPPPTPAPAPAPASSASTDRCGRPAAGADSTRPLRHGVSYVAC